MLCGLACKVLGKQALKKNCNNSKDFSLLKISLKASLKI
jgi:hypothetical protein